MRKGEAKYYAEKSGEAQKEEPPGAGKRICLAEKTYQQTAEEGAVKFPYGCTAEARCLIRRVDRSGLRRE